MRARLWEWSELVSRRGRLCRVVRGISWQLEWSFCFWRFVGGFSGLEELLGSVGTFRFLGLLECGGLRNAVMEVCWVSFRILGGRGGMREISCVGEAVGAAGLSMTVVVVPCCACLCGVV